MIPNHIVGIAEEMLTGPVSISSLSGGINNEVYLCTKGSDSLVIKGYPSQNGKERFAAELNFLRFCEKKAPSFVPKVLEQIDDYNYVVLEFIKGKRYTANEKPTKSDLFAAFNFLKNINDNKTFISLGCAAESFLEIEGYVNNVNNRISNFNVKHLPKEKQLEAKNVLKVLIECWLKTKDWVFSHPHLTIANHLLAEDRIISPSDFGFHNAIKSETGIKFIDFEFSGMDDPSKLLIDFFFSTES